MKDVNKIILIGRLGADPIQRQTKSGVSVVHFSVATSRRFTREDSNGSATNTVVEETQWHQVVAWGKQGEACSQYLKKGNRVYVEGSIKNRQFEDKGGVTKTTVEVHAETVSFLEGRRSDTLQKPESVEAVALA